MTIAIDFPEEIVEKVRSEASFRGILLEAILLEKIQAGLSGNKGISNDRPWMKHFGALRDLHDERKVIEARIAEEFESYGWRGRAE